MVCKWIENKGWREAFFLPLKPNFIYRLYYIKSIVFPHLTFSKGKGSKNYSCTSKILIPTKQIYHFEYLIPTHKFNRLSCPEIKSL